MAESTKKAFLTKDGLIYYDSKSKTWVKAQIATAKSEAIDASAITVDTEITTEGYAKSYTLKQNGATITTIDIPKDMVVSSGRVITNPEGQSEGTYLELTLANATNDKVYINVGTLVDIYTAQENATQVQLAVDNATHVISAEIVDGSIDTDALADGAVTTDKLGTKVVTAAKIADNTITTGQLASGVVTSLSKADTAVQSVTASDASTGTDGTITVDGSEVAVKGYSTLAGKVTALENAEIAEISNSDIDALFTSEPDESPAE